MCLTSIHRNIKTAKEDIHCYKLLEVRNTHLISPYKKYRWYINKLVKLSTLNKDEYGHINEGLHAYLENYSFKRKLLSYWRYNPVIIYNCIIPKGSKYYLGNDDDIVSNQMMITGRYKEKK